MTSLSSRLPRSISVLRHREFALVQVGNAVSQIGTWGQYIALGWAIRELTSWPFAVSLSLVAQFTPLLLLGPVAGAMADRFDRRKLVVFGSLAAVPPAVALGVLTASGRQSVLTLLLLAALGGVATAFTFPAMSAVIGAIVPPGELAEAIASSTVISNLTRVAGPSVGALMIDTLGLQWAFYLNGLSFFAVVVAWSFVRKPTSTGTGREPFVAQFRLGLRFARDQKQIGFLLTVTLVMTLMVFHVALLPVITTDLLDASSSAFALLTIATGVGAIGGALLAGEFVTDRRRRGLIAGSMAVIACMYVVIALSRSLTVTSIALVIYGFGFFSSLTIIQGLLIAISPDAFRGRVMGLFSVTAGSVPLTALAAGGLGSWIGLTGAVLVAATVMAGLLAWMLVTGKLSLIRYELAEHSIPVSVEESS